ncbi:MAG: FAD-dependent oxidoreductase [Lentisphaerae bacterium]|nr:FAD-dependent oxidoreductase [Lentisphaerota bacterium]
MRNLVLRSRNLDILAEAEVVVAGGGAAGVAAAIQAARLGRKVILLEKNNCAGGILSSGLLPCIIHMTDLKNILASGLCKELCEALAKRMQRPVNYNWFNVHPEAVKIELDEMLAAAGVKVIYNVHICDAVVKRKKIIALAVMTLQGMRAVAGSVFIDATGDGLLAFLAGAAWEYGAEDTHEVMSPTLCSFFTNINYEAIPPERRNQGQGRIEWKNARESGEKLFMDEGHFVGHFRNSPTSGIGNLGHIYNTDVLDQFSVTQACIEGRKQAWGFLDFFRTHVPGFENAELAATAGLLGVRESRRITGEYVLRKDDYLERRHFKDDIGCFAYAIDIHSGSADLKKQAAVEINLRKSSYAPGENYGIPYRALLPKNTTNLLVAGRCISTDRAMQASVRIVPGCMITGQAAGTAASQAASGRTTLRKISIRKLQSELRKAGCFLP